MRKRDSSMWSNTTRGLFAISCLAFLHAGASLARGEWDAMLVSLVLGFVANGAFRYRRGVERMLDGIPRALGKVNTLSGKRCTFVFNNQDTGPVEQCVHSDDHLAHGLPHLRDDGYTYMPPETEASRG